MRLSIATKISLAFTGVVFVFTAAIMVGIWRTQTLYGQLQALNRSVIPLSLLLSDAQNDLKSFDAALSEQDPAALERTLRAAGMMSMVPQRVFGKLQRAADLADRDSFDALADAERMRLRAIRTRLKDLADEAKSLDAQAQQFTSALAARPDDAPRAWSDDMAAQRDALRTRTRDVEVALTRLRNDLRISADLALVRANETERANLYAFGAISFAALLLAMLLMGVAILTVRPLGALTEGVKRIAQGEYQPLEWEPSRIGGKDEIATLAEEFDSMAEALQYRDEALREQHAALLKSERLATIGRMTSLITHELRNPLSSIGLNAEMLMDALSDLPADQREDLSVHLETIINEVDRLRDITEEYLVYARLPEPKFAPHDLLDILEQLIDFHDWEWQQEGIQVDVHLPEDPDADWTLKADANQLRQALLNLIKNAVEATAPPDTVDVHALRDGDTYVLQIIDRGDGIPAEIQPRIFEPFFTSKPKGTGLGLAMTQQIIEEHHGQLTFDSAPGGPTTFMVRLPKTGPTSLPGTLSTARGYDDAMDDL